MIRSRHEERRGQGPCASRSRYLVRLFGLHILVCEFETGREWVRGARARWPLLSRWIVRARSHPWAPGRLHAFDELTDPLKTR
jgi:hypothetical protein